MKGNHAIFALLSIVGIIVGILLVMRGYGGEGLGPIVTLILGIFVVIKEVLDLFH